MSDGLNSM